MKFQVCEFQRTQMGKIEIGIAKVQLGFSVSFSVSDVEWIVDSKGRKLGKKELWTYYLIDGPLTCIDTEYEG